ncbi:hypothetical protein BP6252_02691 [Coleophoma cylindrospora]|uniref:WSC domain-containing protein n=1 Tax=Coleophoma cylindrospora TaxID=1849047 RepID=A0A3D8SFW9_9HELO|nr:hypothetical protein BP6252_02691 [Coleophoma cylindrospora]
MALFPLLQPLALLLLCQSTLTSAQSTTTSSAASTSTSTAATIYPGNTKYTYLGCYNETTTINNTAMTRALQGTSESNDTMTVEVCLAFCAGSTYAGLEYTNEQLGNLRRRLEGECVRAEERDVDGQERGARVAGRERAGGGGECAGAGGGGWRVALAVKGSGCVWVGEGPGNGSGTAWGGFLSWVDSTGRDTNDWEGRFEV